MAKRKVSVSRKFSYEKKTPEKKKVEPEPKKKVMYGNKRNLIQDSGNAGANNPVTKHPPE